MKIHWINTSRGESADNRGYYRSYEGRFCIHPNYRHTVYPDSFTIRDRLKGDESSDDRIRPLMQWAESRVSEDSNG